MWKIVEINITSITKEKQNVKWHILMKNMQSRAGQSAVF